MKAGYYTSLTRLFLKTAIAFFLPGWLWPVPAFAQASFKKNLDVPLSRSVNYEYERVIQLEHDSTHHSAIKPYLYENFTAPGAAWRENKTGGLRGKKLFTTHLAGGEKWHIDPVLNIAPGYDFYASGPFMRLEGGAELVIAPLPQLSGTISYMGGKSSFPSFLDTVIDSLKVIPGFGRAYGSNGEYSYQQLSGYASYSPNKVFNFQAGQGKNFWGDGYRSLFLSDVANNYPFLRITSSIWRLKYVNLYARLQDFGPSVIKADLLPKYGTFHYLSYNATRWLNLSLFESIVWQGSDTSRTRNFDINYLNPVIFFRPVEYSLGSSDNAIIGGSMKVKIRGVQLYGQLVLDEFLLKEIRENRGWWGNKYGYQAGIKAFDLFKVKHLYFQAEYNTVRPYTYTHGSVRQSYTHFSQPLAHPLGANFKEAMAFLGYRYKRWQMEGKLLYAEYGADSAGTNYGHNLLLSYSTRPGDFGHVTGQGIALKLAVADLRIAYLLNPVYNLVAEMRASARITRLPLGTEQYPFVQLGLKTDLFNFYDDF